MFDIDALGAKKLPELQEIAAQLKISRFKTLKKQDLIYQILDVQAQKPESVQKIEPKGDTEKTTERPPRNKERNEQRTERNDQKREPRNHTRGPRSKENQQKEQNGQDQTSQEGGVEETKKTPQHQHQRNQRNPRQNNGQHNGEKKTTTSIRILKTDTNNLSMSLKGSSKVREFLISCLTDTASCVRLTTTISPLLTIFMSLNLKSAFLD